MNSAYSLDLPCRRLARWFLPLLLAASLLACDEGEPQGPDADAADAVADADALPGDVADTADTGPDVVAPSCERQLPEPAAVDPSQTRFALSLYHFNIEYVIGGLEFTDADGKVHRFAGQNIHKGWDNAKVEDWIVTETFEPIIDLYLKHPTWKVDIELQAYMIEVMAERHPEVLDKLRELAWAGGAELISFHYAAQLFLAFPRADHARSLARVREVFEDHCLPLSGVVFNQEGQAGEGRQRMLVEEGWEIGVFPKNLFRYEHVSAKRWPWYESEGGTLIVGPGDVDPDSGVEVVWDFFDDGELRAVPEAVNPYFAALEGHSPERVAELEAQLMAREADGYLVTSISDYVRHLDLMGVEKPQAPPLLDGTWQPTSTDTSIHRWLGGASLVWHEDERDIEVRSGNATARMHLHATQVLADSAAADGLELGDIPAELAAAWDDLFHAQVSDATGVNPWLGEVVWCSNLNAAVLERSEALRTRLLALLETPHAQVDLRTGAVTKLGELPSPEPLSLVDAPLAVEIEAFDRDQLARWYEVSTDHWRLVLELGAPNGDATCPADADCDNRTARLSFPRTEEVLAYSPGLIEDEVRSYPLSDFDFEVGEVWLPLANGLIGLGDDLWAIKHVRAAHMGVRVATESATVDFVDQTIPEDEGAMWVFDVVRADAATALDRANRINIDPAVIY